MNYVANIYPHRISEHVRLLYRSIFSWARQAVGIYALSYHYMFKYTKVYILYTQNYDHVGLQERWPIACDYLITCSVTSPYISQNS